MPSSNMQTTDQWGTLLPKGLGNDQEATQATAAMRQSPWYQDWAKKNNLQFEDDQYGNAKMNDSQRQQLYDLALKNGIGLNDKYDQIDENGQISEAHHKLRNTLIAAAIGGAGLTGLGAFGIGPLAGMLGAGTSGAAGAAGGTTFGSAGAGIGAAGTGIGTTAAGAGSLAGTLGTAAGAGGSIADILAKNHPDMIPNQLSTSMSNNGLPSIQELLAANHPEMIGNKLATSIDPETLSMLQSTKTQGGQSIWDLLTRAEDNPMANLSSSIGSLGQGIANNRVTQGNFTQAYDRNMLQAQKDAADARNNAMKNLQQSSYIMGQDKGYTPANLKLPSGRQVQLSDFGFGYKAPTEDVKQGASLLHDQALKTLGPDGTYTPRPLSEYATPGTGENLANVGAAITGMVPSIAPIAKSIPWGKIGSGIMSLF